MPDQAYLTAEMCFQSLQEPLLLQLPQPIKSKIIFGQFLATNHIEQFQGEKE